MTDGASLQRPRWTRRLAIGAGLAAVAGGSFALLRKEDRGGGGHHDYFQRIQLALRNAGIAHPVMVIDRKRLSGNIAHIREWTKAANMPLRIVAKSLPSPALIGAVSAGLGTNRQMLFSAQMARHVLSAFPDADVLMGKPLPVAEFVSFVKDMGPAKSSRIQWLIDTPQRLEEYAAAAGAQMPLRVNFEIDVGLHRGGFATPQDLAEALAMLGSLSRVRAGGLMGYDPHVAKMSDPDAAYAESQSRYRAFQSVFGPFGGRDGESVTYNGAGSPTFRRHLAGSVANEVSVGSAFVKPGDFDLDLLEPLLPAAFIATPLIKAAGRLQLPGYEWLTGPLGAYDPNMARAFFVHGGHWLAKPVSPAGLQYSGLYGRSSNQEMLTGSGRVAIAPGETVFLRPDQSEAIFLQFGDLVVYENGAITDRWPTFPASA